ncbi:flavohemoglobin expression-modulating QEGLA motif protein [Engelhardtia mirabilis]|uniref:DUF1704 domain-containing protein n=1 Tax=Engelhardtia mirabilis TaxID=2528011 RepID=A0A518BM31_9BACT|nr:hypothetical protein Pla133_31290 [Planctomycetes bacterium Pla133]QDV02364.1 hypothetical protein Pla86_31280 [Planctomycetes bacterium Pla86]
MKPEQITETARRLRTAESGVRILRTLSWSPEVRREFFARDARELPRVTYPVMNAAPIHAQLAEIRRGIEGDGTVARWLRRCADAIGSSADMLASAGTPAFLEYGKRLYGTPTSQQGDATALALAQTVERVCDSVAGLDLGAPSAACHFATAVAQGLRRACVRLFGDQAPEVVVVDQLSANALAGPRRIQVRRDACFTDRDLNQLIQHEAYVHVCTSLNGRAQAKLPILAASHAGTTRTQEGLAVFAEFITGTQDPDRLRRLADRVLAIDMALRGADFLEVYRFFLGRGIPREQAFENARRVFRGGVVEGGVPFTKDVVYLDGFLRVTNMLRAIVAGGRADCLSLLFCGKLDLEDFPALAELSEIGLCAPPTYLPPWAADRRFLVSYLAYSQFLDGVRVDEHRSHYRELLGRTDTAPWGGETVPTDIPTRGAVIDG